VLYIIETGFVLILHGPLIWNFGGYNFTVLHTEMDIIISIVLALKSEWVETLSALHDMLL